jgi:hypothetical protein
MNLSQDQAQSLVDFYASKTKEAYEAPFNLWKQTQEDWVSQIRQDPEIGGKLDQVRTTVSRAIDSLGDPNLSQAFREAMDYTGAGNNPAFVKGFYRLAQRLTEGTSVRGGGPSPLGQTPSGRQERPSAARAMYPDLPTSQTG